MDECSGEADRQVEAQAKGLHLERVAAFIGSAWIRRAEGKWISKTVETGGQVVKDVLEYKGYIGSVRYDDDDAVFHGKLEGIRDLVTYEGVDVATIRKGFRNAVDDYVQTCRENGRQPDMPFKGTFNVRVGADLHKRAALYASQHKKKLNAVVSEALEHYLEAVAD